jgi:ubiquinone/menaquinone biosynthesis C-methylase UbiE
MSDQFDKWGSAKYKGQWIDINTDKNLIKDVFTLEILSFLKERKFLRIADFGCGEGYVLNTVLGQLENIEIQVEPIGVDNSKKSLELMKEKFPEISNIQADLLDLPDDIKGIDVGIMRFTLQHFGKKEQAQVLENIYKALEVNGVLIIMQSGPFENKAEEYDNDFLIEINAIRSGLTVEEFKKIRYFPPALKLGEMAEGIGFKIGKMVNLTNEAVGYISPQAYASRFNFDSVTNQKITDAFQEWKDKGVLFFKQDSLRVLRQIFYIVLIK